MKKVFKTMAALILASLTLTVSSCVPSNYTTIAGDGKTDYRIVRSDVSDIGASAAADLKKAMETVVSDKVEIMTDFEHEKLGTMRIDTEILVGETNRDESKMHERVFTYYDYAIDFDTTRISITGGSSEALVNAVSYFTDSFVFQKQGKIALPKGQVTEYIHDYPVDSFTINGTPIEEYVIICNDNDGRGRELASAINKVYGAAPTAVNTNYKDKVDFEIILSSANDTRYTEAFSELSVFEYMYKVEGDKIYIGTGGELPDSSAWEMFVADLFGGDVSALSGDIAITDCEKIESVPTAPFEDATPELMAEVEKRAEDMKKKVMESPNLEIPENARVYYVSPNGDDTLDGLSPETAWKSLEKVNALDYPGKAYILFERGGIWRGQISAKGNKVYSAYGEGEKPALYGGHEDGAKPEKWTLLEGTDNIWVYKDEMIDSGTLVFNGGEIVAYKEIPSYINGKFMTRADNTIEFDIIKALDVDLDFFHKADSVLTNGAYPTSGTAKGEIYLRCDRGNPGEIFESIEFVPRRNGFAVAGDDVTIDNFTIKFIGAHGIGSGTRKNLIVTNCEIGWIGGGIQSYAANGDTNQRATRFGNGVEIYGGCDTFTVDNCYVYQCYDAGLTHQYKSEKMVKQENVTYSNNIVENCVYSIEYFLNAFEDPEQKMYNIKMHDNLLRFAGFGWGNQRPDKGSPAHIKGWDHDNPAEGFDIYNNTFDRSTNWILHCGYHLPESEPRVYDNVFIQYHDGLFGRYDLVPTKVIAYGSSMLTDERLFDNKFYFINENVKRYIGDRGALGYIYNNVRVYTDDELIELHGEKITDAAELAKIKDAFKTAESTAALLTKFGGVCDENDTLKTDDAQYVKFLSCQSLEEMKKLIEASFGIDLAEKIADLEYSEKVPLFKETEDGLYRIADYTDEETYENAVSEVTDCYISEDGEVMLKVHVTYNNGEVMREFDAVYKCLKSEDGKYRFISGFEMPIAIAKAID